ncbi:MAG: chemotaxis protein CheX [Thermoguttaceae bacterium]
MSETTGLNSFSINTTITNSIILSVESCFSMCELKVRVVGLSRIPSSLPAGNVTGMIGMNGKCTGFLTITMPERVATLAVSGLLQDEFPKINSQVLDGVGELTNIVCGGLKTRLYNTPWMIGNITIPSIIVGSNYNIAYSKGIEFGAVTFEIDDPETLTIQDRIFLVTTSLMQVP